MSYRSPRRRRTQRFTRSALDRILGGVCGGLGEYLGISSWWVRFGFIGLIAFTLGAGVLLYFVLWLAIPEQTLADVYLLTHQPIRRVNPETLVLLGGGIILIGIAVMALNVGVFDNANAEALLPFIVTLLGLALLAQQLGRPTA